MQTDQSRIGPRPVLRHDQITTFRIVATRDREFARCRFERGLNRNGRWLRRRRRSRASRLRRNGGRCCLDRRKRRYWRGRIRGSQEHRQAASENCQGNDNNNRRWIARINVFHTIYRFPYRRDGFSCMVCSLYSSILPIGASVGGGKALSHSVPTLGNIIRTLRKLWETANLC